MHRDRDSRRLIPSARQVEQRAHLLFALYAKRIGIRAELAAGIAFFATGQPLFGIFGAGH